MDGHRFLSALVIPVLLGLAAPVLSAPSASAADAADTSTGSTARPTVMGTTNVDDSQGLDVAIDGLTPTVLTTQSEVTITGSVTNTSDVAVAAPELQVFFQSRTPVSTDELTRFLSGTQSTGPQVASTTLEGPLPAGTSTTFSVTVPTSDLPLGDSFDWGPRGLTVRAASGQASGQDRTILTWDSDYEVANTVLNTVIPWTSGTDADESSVLSLARTDGATLAVDPEVLSTDDESGQSGDSQQSATDSASPSSSASASPSTSSTPSDSLSQNASPETSTSPDPSASATMSGDAGPSTTQSGARVSVLAHQLMTTADEIVALPRWDADPGALALGNDDTLLDLAQNSRQSLASADPTGTATVIDDVVWPDASTFGRQLLEKEQGQVVIAPTGQVAPSAELTFTSVSRVEVDAASGRTSTTGATDSTTTVLTSQADISDLLGWQTSSSADDLDARQVLQALTAIITREKPNESRTLLATVPRSTPINDQLVGRVQALVQSRWISPAAFSTVRDSAPTDQERSVVTDSALDEATTRSFQTISDSLEQIDPLAQAISDPDALTTQMEDLALRSLSASLTEQERDDQTNALTDRVTTLLGSVRAEPSVTVNLINKSANFPVRVTNDLDWDVTVRVSLTPSDPRLRVTSTQEATIPARSTTPVEVPVSAIGSGNIEVVYRVTTPDGHVLDDTQSVTVRMRAGWEDTATTVIAILLAVALVTGVARTVRRRRPPSTTTEEDA